MSGSEAARLDSRSANSVPGGPTAQILTLNEINGAPESDAAPAADAARLINPLHQVKAKVTVCVGMAELSVGELLGAKERQVLRLDRKVNQAVDVMIEGQIVARGTLVAVDDHFGVLISELPMLLKV
jgi:flagellar motor switch protein FliN/FliY